MGKLKKHLIFLYLTLMIIFVANMASKIVISPNFSIFNYVPLESDLVIEVNTASFVKEVGYQKIYKSTYFESNEIVLDDFQYDYNLIKNAGIDFFSKTIIFRETWSNGPVWFVLIKLTNQSDFEVFCKDYIQPNEVSFFDGYALLQMNYSSKTDQIGISQHVDNIKQLKVKSILANPAIQSNFSKENEINVYLKASKSDFITDGFLNVNFFLDKVEIKGHFSPIANGQAIQPIQYAVNSDKAFSLRSSLNLFHSLYLFNDTKLEALPDYHQLSFDYDGATLLTVNEHIPVHTYPNLNLKLESISKTAWQTYLDELEEIEQIERHQDTIVIDSWTKTLFRYALNETTFDLFQSQENLTQNNDSTVYFDLSVVPAKLLDKTFFKKDEKNPPKMFATLQINIVQSFLEELQYLDAVESFNFSITKTDHETDYKSQGSLVYQAKQGHSMIESFILSKRFMDTLGGILLRLN